MRLYAASSAKLLLLGLATVSISGCTATNSPQTSSSGNVIWSKCLGGSATDYCFGIAHASDGGSVMVGMTSSIDGDVTLPSRGGYDLWIVKQTPDGAIDWQRRLGGSESEFEGKIEQTSDQGYIVAAASPSKDGDLIAQHQYGLQDMWIMKLDDSGHVMWQTTHGGSSNEFAHAVTETHDGGFIIAGATASNDLDVVGHHGSSINDDFWIIKLDKNGVFVWATDLGGTGEDRAYAVANTSDNGAIVVGSSKSSDGDVTGHRGQDSITDCWVVKLDALGKLEWENSYGGTGEDVGSGVLQTPDNGYIIAGSSTSTDGDVATHLGAAGESNAWILNLSADGKIQSQRSFANSSAESMRRTRDGGCILAGTTVTGPHGAPGVWIAKLSPNADLEWQRNLGGSSPQIGWSADQTTDGSYIVGGVTESNDGDVSGNHGGIDAWVIKLHQ